MVDTALRAGLTTLPLAPRNPLPYRQRVRSARHLVDGLPRLRDAGGPVSRVVFVPRWLAPPVVLVSSPQGARDILGRTDEIADRGKVPVMREMRRLMGGNLLDLPHYLWLPRRRALQPMFTKKQVPRYAGHMAAAAQAVADGWPDGQVVDIDRECRLLTLRALGRSVLGIDLHERADTVGPALRDALEWIGDRAAQPVNLPQWFPTAGQRRARAANARLHALAADILAEIRADPDRDAPLLRALLAATDPQTGRPLSDDEICAELVLFMLAGHDTTSTTLTYALWELGRNPAIQDRVAAEVRALGDRSLTPEDVPRLGYTVQVLHEALRLCPPAAVVMRTTTEDITVDGYRVQAGTAVAVALLVMHRDPTLWDRPERFDPDRFLPERSASRNRWQYLPFGGGPRSCVGDHFAMLEATLALATIVGNKRVESLSEEFPLETPFTVTAAAPVPARTSCR